MNIVLPDLSPSVMSIGVVPLAQLQIGKYKRRNKLAEFRCFAFPRCVLKAYAGKGMTRSKFFGILVGTEEHCTRLRAPRKDISGQAEWRIAISLEGTVTRNVKDRAPHGVMYKKLVRHETVIPHGADGKRESEPGLDVDDLDKLLRVDTIAGKPK